MNDEYQTRQFWGTRIPLTEMKERGEIIDGFMDLDIEGNIKRIVIQPVVATKEIKIEVKF